MYSFDEAHDTSFVREIEMTVDTYMKNNGRNIQFWKDVQLYGIHEALMFLKNDGFDEKVETDVLAILTRMETNGHST